MSGAQPAQDEAISQFSNLTGVAPSEVSYTNRIDTPEHLEADTISRQDSISKQISGTFQLPLPNTTPHSKRQPTRDNLQLSLLLTLDHSQRQKLLR